jgi:ABC-type multidrug transport system fused ATPase/permease subunit
MSDIPSISVLVSADLAALESNLRKGEAAVAKSMQTMEQTVQRSGISRALGANFDPVVVNRAARGIAAATEVMRTDFSTIQGTVMGISGAIAMIPFPLTKIVGLLGIAGATFIGLLDNSKQLAAAEAERAAKMEEMQRRSANSAIVKDLERQLQIEKETDPIRRLQIEHVRTMERLTRELNDNLRKMSEEEAFARYEAERRLEAAKTENAILKERTKIADDAARKAAEAEKARQGAMAAMMTSRPGFGAAGSVTTSLGGVFNFAQNTILNGIQQATIRSAGYQANLVLTAKEILQILRNQGTVIT